jgi:hypothetical protein
LHFDSFRFISIYDNFQIEGEHYHFEFQKIEIDSHKIYITHLTIIMSDQTYTEEICEGCGDSLDICESSSHPCYKCDGGCGKVMGSNDNCIRICEDCKKFDNYAIKSKN